MRECQVKQCPPALPIGEMLDGSVWWEYRGARRSVVYREFRISQLIFPDDARRISQYSCLTPIHDPH